MLAERVWAGAWLEAAPPGFDLCARLLGQGAANLEYIRSETGAMIILKGSCGDKITPLHFCLSHTDRDKLDAACSLAQNLMDSIRQDYQQWTEEHASHPNPIPQNMPPNVAMSLPPPTIQPLIQQQLPPVNVVPSNITPLNMSPMQPQVLQIVPQQQLFVGQDGSHYIKVTFAQTPTNDVHTLSMAGQVMQPSVVQPVVQPIVQQDVMPLPAVCLTPTLHSAPTLTVSSNTNQTPWAVLQNQLHNQQADKPPCPMGGYLPSSGPSFQFSGVPPPGQASIAPQWTNTSTAPPTPLNPKKPWSSDAKSDNQQLLNQASDVSKLPWYKNSQNSHHKALGGGYGTRGPRRSSEFPVSRFDVLPAGAGAGDQNQLRGAEKNPLWSTSPADKKTKRDLREAVERIEAQVIEGMRVDASRERGYIAELRKNVGAEGVGGERRDRRRERRSFAPGADYRRDMISRKLEDIQSSENRDGQEQPRQPWASNNYRSLAPNNDQTSRNLLYNQQANQYPSDQFAATTQRQSPEKPNQKPQKHTIIAVPTNAPPPQTPSWAQQHGYFNNQLHPWNNGQSSGPLTGNQFNDRPWNNQRSEAPPLPPQQAHSWNVPY